MSLNTSGKNEIDNLCFGCDSYSSCGIPEHHLVEEIAKCPCTRCLVKMVCEGICDDYRKFMRKLRP